MKKYFTLTLFILLITSVSAQDSLRLTFKLKGFKAKDQLGIYFGEGSYSLPTDRDSLTIFRKLDSPERMTISYKSRIRSFWVDNNDITVEVSKEGIRKGFEVIGSSAEDFWQNLLSADQKERAKILEENIDRKIAQHYLAYLSHKLLPEDRERLLAMSDSRTEDMADYNISLLGSNKVKKLKVGDQIMDFTAATIEDDLVSTSDLRGKYILLDFAGTGCGWCWIAYPQMVELLSKRKNLQVLTINEDFFHERWQKIADSKNIDLPWPVLWKAENKRAILEKYGIQVLPTHYLISPDGIILERWQGAREGKLERVIEKYGIN